MPADLRRPVAVLAGLLAVAAIGLLAFACDGGGGEGGDEADIDPEAKALLEQMVLVEQDLATGLVLVSGAYSTNQDVADAVSNSEAELAKLAGWGRRMGYDIQFAPGPGASSDLEVQGIQNTVSLYNAALGASDSFAEGVRKARDADWPAIYPDLLELDVSEIDRPDLGDESVWFRISGLDSSERLVVDDQVVFRVGAVRGFLRVVTLFDAGTDRNVYLEQVESWAQIVTERIPAARTPVDMAATPTP